MPLRHIIVFMVAQIWGWYTWDRQFGACCLVRQQQMALKVVKILGQVSTNMEGTPDRSALQASQPNQKATLRTLPLYNWNLSAYCICDVANGSEVPGSVSSGPWLPAAGTLSDAFRANETPEPMGSSYPGPR